MKILICRFNGLGEKGIIDSLKRLGYTVFEYDKKCDNYDTDISYLEGLAASIDRYKPDKVFSINYFPIVSKVCKIYGLLYYSWVYDCPELHLYSKSITNKVNRIFVFDKVMYERLKRRSLYNIFYLPLATEPVEDFDSWISNEEKKRYSHDITFIGSLYNEKKRQYHQLESLPDYERGYIEGLVQAQVNVFGYNFIMDSLSDDIVERIRKQLGYESIDDYEIEDREIIADHYIGVYASSIERIKTLQKVADVHTLSIYTDSDISMLNNVENCGIADSVTMTPKIYHLSKINLNITMKPIQSGVPLRVFDVLGVGGFLITNYQPEILKYFEDGKDLVVYESLDDLQYKIHYYLEHEDERKKIARQGYKKVKENFTYEKLLEMMMMLNL